MGQGAPNAQGEPAPSTPARQPDQDRDREYLTSLWKGANAEGREKGRKEGRELFLRELGVASESELRQKLGLEQPAHQPPAGQGGEWEKLARQLQAEHAETSKKAQELEAQLQRYAAQDARALRSEVVAELVKAGAHPAGAEDLARALVPSPDGPPLKVVRASDGQGFVVMERGAGGEFVPSKHPWSKYVETLRKDRPHFWPSGTAGGSGGNNAPAPGASGAGGSGWDFYANARRIAKGE